MNRRPIIEEKYRKGKDVINFVVYSSTTGPGNDGVLQHKIMGTTETAHITLHPDGTVHFRVKRSKGDLELAVRASLSGYIPMPSAKLREFLEQVRGKI